MQLPTFEKVQQSLLITILFLLPFNLIIGRVFPLVVSLPFYIVDTLILLFGFFSLFSSFKQDTITSSQKYVMLFLFLSFCLGVFSVFLYKIEILQFIAGNITETIIHSMFKQIVSHDPTQSVNKTIQIAFSLFLFLGICSSPLKKDILLKILCIPLTIILITNVYLVINQQDVALDGGKAGVTIHPYGIKEIGRAYFPFVNSLLLSMYLSLFFFVVLYLYLQSKGTDQKIGLGSLLYLLIIVIGFTKGRAALLTISVLFLITLFYIRTHVSPFPKIFCSLVAIFLFVTILSSFFTFSRGTILENLNPIPENTLETEITSQEVLGTTEIEGNTNESKNNMENTFILRETDVDTTHAGRRSLHWPTALVLFKSDPLFGVGTGMFYYSVVSEKKEILCQQKELCPDFIQPSDISSTAHSIYLQVLAENGITGILLFVLFLILLLFLGHKTIQKDIVQKKYCSLFIFTALIAFFIQGLFFSYFEYREVTYLFWIFVGLLLKKE